MSGWTELGLIKTHSKFAGVGPPWIEAKERGIVKLRRLIERFGNLLVYQHILVVQLWPRMSVSNPTGLLSEQSLCGGRVNCSVY